MSKKQAEQERVNLEERTEIVILMTTHLQALLDDMAVLANSYPQPWVESRATVAGNINRVARALQTAVKELLEVADDCKHMDKHQRNA